MSGLDVGALLDEYDADTRPVRIKKEPLDDDYRSGRDLVERPSRLSGVLDREREGSPAGEVLNANGREYTTKYGILGESPRQHGSPKIKTEDAHDDDRQYRDRSDRDSGRRRRDRNSSSVEASGRRGSNDYYRGEARSSQRSRSPGRSNRGRRDYDERDRGDRYRDHDSRGDRDSYRGGRDRERRERRRSPSPRRARTPEPTEDERDRRTVFVQQLAARLRTKDLIQFFEKVGPVKEAQIVKDRVSGRSKG
jgi:RNA-binding protein 39